MSKQLAAPQVGGEPPSRARATNTAPSRGAAAAQPPTRHRNASVQSERQAVAGTPRDGAPIRAVRARVNTVATYDVEEQQGGPRWERTGEGRSPHVPEQPLGHGGAEDTTPAKPPPRLKPSYVPPSQRRREQPRETPSRPAVEQPPYQYGSVPEGRPGAPPRRSKTAGTAAPIERVSTLKEEDDKEAAQTRPGSKLHRGQLSPIILPSKRRKRQPMAFCFIACCILFWLVVIAVGVAVLVVYLIYRPQPPRLRVTSATLNSGYIDELGGGRMALNSDLTVLAAISNPNTKIHIVLYYMQLDLYFQGSPIGTQAVWPAPLHEGPGDSVLRSVHLVVSEVTMTREDVMVWQNETARGGPVTLHLYGRFHTQLNFGRWLPFKYWVNPRCTLWLDPPPSGALRRARC